MNWGLVIPSGDWVEGYPTTNGKIILGMRLAFLYVTFVLVLIIAVFVVTIWFKGVPIDKVPWNAVTDLLSMLGWFIAGMVGLSIAQYVGKRATTDPTVVKAISDAKIAEAVTPGSVTTTTSVSTAPAKPPEGEKGP